MTHASRRPQLARRLSWLMVASLTLTSLFAPSSVAAADVVAHTAQPSATATATATATARATLEPTPAPTETPGPTASPVPTDLPSPSPTATPEPTEAPTPTPTATTDPTPSPTPQPTEEPRTASILIVKLDDQGTQDPADDTLLDGADFAVHRDDGDGLFEPGEDLLVFGPATAVGGMLDTTDLAAGAYWIVETTVPAGYVGSDPILMELNLDQTVSCAWDALGLIECTSNGAGAEHLSWTVVLVDNSPQAVATPTPSPSGSGGVGGATGTPSITLPPTDVQSAGLATPAGDGWRLVLLALAGILATALVLTPAAAVVRREHRR